MFEKHTTLEPTNGMYEKKSKSGYYQIFEIENGRYIDVDHYLPYLEYEGKVPTIDKDISPLTEEQKWESIRGQRDSYLSRCDWTDLPNAPLTKAQKVIWLKYRADLRDITKTYNDPDKIVWPTSP